MSWENRYAGLSVGTWEVGRLEVTKCFEHTCETLKTIVSSVFAIRTVFFLLFCAINLSLVSPL